MERYHQKQRTHIRAARTSATEIMRPSQRVPLTTPDQEDKPSLPSSPASVVTDPERAAYVSRIFTNYTLPKVSESLQKIAQNSQTKPEAQGGKKGENSQTPK